MSAFTDNPVLISGAARSGTSLVAGIVEKCGAFGGKTMGPTANNQRGMFENAAIRQSVTKAYMRRLGVDPMGQDPLPDRLMCQTDAPYWGPEVRARVAKIMQADGYRRGPWYYKGPKMCLIWPLWHWAFPRAKWIIVRRADRGIIDSCLRTNFMRAYRTTSGWQSWLDIHKECFKEMEAAGLDIREIWPEEIVADKMAAIKEAINWAGLKWNQKAINEFIAPELFHASESKGKAKCLQAS